MLRELLRVLSVSPLTGPVRFVTTLIALDILTTCVYAVLHARKLYIYDRQGHKNLTAVKVDACRNEKVNGSAHIIINQRLR